MSRALDQAIERMTPGTILEVVEQTKRPELVGSTRTIIRRSSKLVFETTNIIDGETIESAMELPQSNLTWLDDGTITYPLFGGKGIGAGHTVTLRFLDGAS